MPGCRHTAFLDLHHLRPREEGGGHEADNLITLCGAHHRAAHEGQLRVEGSISSGISFKHADGTNYGAIMGLAAPVVDAQAKAFRALRQLGFGEREARQVLAEVLDELGPDAGTEARLRAALELLTATAFRTAS